MVGAIVPCVQAAAMDGVRVQRKRILCRRTFTVSVQQIHRLKQRIADRSASTPSSFVAVAALVWVSFVRAKHPGTIAAADEVTLFFFADCRVRIASCLARATARDQDDDGSLACAATAVAEEVRRAAEEPLALWDWMSLVRRVDVDLDRFVNVSGSTRFPAYEVSDFGWGPLGRTELVTMSHDGQVVLVGGKGGAGGRVEVSVSSNTCTRSSPASSAMLSDSYL